MQYKFITIILVFFFLSCSKNKKVVSDTIVKPNNLIPEDTLVNMIVDIRLVDAASFNSEGKQRNKLEDLKFVYKKYRTSDSAFKESHNYYTRFPKKILRIYEKSINKLSILQADYYDKQ